MKKTPAILAVGLIGLATLAVSPAARAADAAPTGIVVAQDTARALSAVPAAPRAIEIQAQPRDEITVTATGERSRQVRADRQGTARVTGLTAGTTYSVTTADAATTVTPMLAAGRARNLQVTTTHAADAVLLTWQHRATPARGEIGYRLEATPVGEADTVPLTIVDRSRSVRPVLLQRHPVQRPRRWPTVASDHESQPGGHDRPRSARGEAGNSSHDSGGATRPASGSPGRASERT